ncbi:cache domain-containing sensor histidine kinase [Sediminibacillus terrae]|uniref:cache domain-containing sensor histidine kinase n=1 Tax=Sediminibacillus terrae TaxID=1562106 RepID=UPI0012957498|nr:histidine kinase [Sediminibacillus terrae]
MINKFMNLPLQKKLMTFFITAAVIPLVLVGIFTYQKSKEIVKEQVSAQVMEGLIQINKNLSFFQQDIEQLSSFIYSNELVQETLHHSSNRSDIQKYNDFQKMDELFQTLTESKSWDVNIYVIGLNGDRYFTGDYLPHQYDQFMENWGIFRKAKDENGSMTWETRYTIRQVDNRDVVLSAGRVIKDRQTDQPLGYLIIDIPETTIAKIYQSEENQYATQKYLLDAKGYVISSYPNKTTVGLKLDHPSLDTITSNQRGYLNTTLDKAPSIAVYDTGEASEYKIVSFIPEQEVVGGSRLIGYIALTIGLIGLIIAAWVSFFLSKALTKPIDGLIGSMREVRKGNMQARFQYPYKDEFNDLGLSFNHMVKRVDGLIKESVERKTLLKDAELKSLRAQLNPHFLFNTLETISFVSKMNGIKIISQMAYSLGEMLRSSINKEKEFVPLEEEINLLNHYLFIQKIRFEDKIHVVLDVSVNMKHLLVPVLMIQPLVENAISHGLEMKEGKGRPRYIDR